MAKRRLEKIARVITESVSDTVTQRLSDPRITGIISVTEVVVSPDMKNATVLLSIMCPDDEKKQAAFAAIQRASGPIQSRLGKALTARFCPHLRFELDRKMQNTLQTMRLIAQAASELPENKNSENNTQDADDEKPTL